VNLGEPWLPGSACDHGLISLPYPWGPELEDGLAALEERFQAARLDFTNPGRASVV
jgi:hypothetical protein